MSAGDEAKHSNYGLKEEAQMKDKKRKEGREEGKRIKGRRSHGSATW